jgi:hypothetical protein
VAKIGGGNPIPTQIGGGLSFAERIYKAMRAAIGEENVAAEGTIAAAWMWCRARGMAAAFADQRAVNQIWPDRATDGIPIFESILGIATTAAMSDEDRRQEIIRRMVLIISGVSSDLEDELQIIDPLFSLLPTERDSSDTTENGRGFEDYDPNDPASAGPAFGGGRSSTDWPNFSRDFVVTVQYDIAAGTATAEQKRRIEQAKQVLNDVLPAWVAFEIISNPSGGFILDTSLLDLGAFNP